MTDNSALEKIIEIKLIQEDAETILSIMKVVHDPIFAITIMPYYALFVHECQMYLGETYIKEEFVKQIKDIRNYIKIFDKGLEKSKKRMHFVDSQQDCIFRSSLRLGFTKNWNIHYNLGTYWTENKHVIGNTQMMADFLNVEDMSDTEVINHRMYNLAKQIGSFAASVKYGLEQINVPPEIAIKNIKTDIGYYCDLNTNRDCNFFVIKNKELNLYLLNLLCNLNFIKHVLRPMFENSNSWMFRIEYIVTYYTYRALVRLKNYGDNNNNGQIKKEPLQEAIHIENDIFCSKFRNCMMHYGIQNQEIYLAESADKPLFGMIDTCFDMDFDSYCKEMRGLANRMTEYLEDCFDFNKVKLKKLGK